MRSPDKTQADLLTPQLVPVAELGPDERLACLRLIRSENVGPVTFRQLINHYGGAQAALAAIPELSRRGGRKNAIRIYPEDAAAGELERAEALNAQPIFTIEPGYPAALSALDHPPPLLYVKGRTELLNMPGVAVVGSRKCSAAGASFARQVSAGLSQAGLAVISGLARGIDAAAHQAAINGGTIAVLAGGIDNIYPPEHTPLYEAIAEQGCLVSERPPGFKPRGQDFPRRNRIISGMAMAVLVVEAARRSGSLTTARIAADQGREVFAVPGHPLDPRAEGTNRLIKGGAKITTCADDIVSDIAPMLRQELADPQQTYQPAAVRPPPLPLTAEDRDVITAALGPAPVSLDDLCRATGRTARSVQATILELSLAGRIQHHGQHLVSLLPETVRGEVAE